MIAGPGTVVVLPPGTVHRMEALEDSRFFEVSTPELDDVVRIEDDYGRAGTSDAMKPIDLRSDTFTLPSPEMRKAMADAELGDDVFGEDPTVNRLEAMVAERTGKEAALFVTSGTQGNLIAHAHPLPARRRGDRWRKRAHPHARGRRRLGGRRARAAPCAHRRARAASTSTQVRADIRPDDEHFPRTGLICVENTHNRAGGTVQNEEDLAAVRDARRPSTASPSTSTARGSSTPRSSSECLSPTSPRSRDSDLLLPLEGAGLPRRLAPLRHEGLHRTKRGATARCSAAACARRASSPRPASTHSRTWSTASPKTTKTRSTPPKASPACPA